MKRQTQTKNQTKSRSTTKTLDPQEFGLPNRTLLEQVDEQTIALVIRRKSRLIRADGKKILEKTGKIKKIMPGSRVILATTAPVCSKTMAMLDGAGVSTVTIGEDGEIMLP